MPSAILYSSAARCRTPQLPHSLCTALPCRLDGGIDNLRARFRNSRDDSAIGGIDIVKLPIAGDELSVYKVFQLLNASGWTLRSCFRDRSILYRHCIWNSNLWDAIRLNRGHSSAPADWELKSDLSRAEWMMSLRCLPVHRSPRLMTFVTEPCAVAE